ncbi:hypothetical protein OGAPHI_001048 [Ogataea philodendri]|uniref:Uncharacterized protein n=1 Tax=Ogataea philodendri TaxID=1378263 RepID=A0A9P8T8Q3_9ASCO|nr:uncharacterized protein OGAPHI_001048 [Ogataea philodendri]KAH3670533.1 hypothetical protein OGAPHI_001048 [Ogataea philodendri]
MSSLTRSPIFIDASYTRRFSSRITGNRFEYCSQTNSKSVFPVLIVDASSCESSYGVPMSSLERGSTTGSSLLGLTTPKAHATLAQSSRCPGRRRWRPPGPGTAALCATFIVGQLLVLEMAVRIPMGVAWSAVQQHPQIVIVKIIIGIQIPEHWESFFVDVVTQKQVDGFLTLGVDKRVAVKSFHALYHVARMRRPLVDLPVRLQSVDEMRPAVLQRNGVSVVVEHFCKDVDSVRVVLEVFFLDEPESVQLVTQRALANHKLRCVGSVETVDAVCATHSVLELCVAESLAVVEEPGGLERASSVVLQPFNHVLAPVLGRPRHVPGRVVELVVFRKKLVEILDAVFERAQQLCFARRLLALLDEVQDLHGSTVPFKQVVEMQSRGGVERVYDVDLDRRLGDPDIGRGFLRPRQRDRPAVLHKRRVARIIVEPCRWVVERRCEHVANNLLCFDLVCHVAAIVDSSFEEPGPSKMVRPSGYDGDVNLHVKDGNVYLVNKPVDNRLEPVVHPVERLKHGLEQKRVPNEPVMVLKRLDQVLFVQPKRLFLVAQKIHLQSVGQVVVIAVVERLAQIDVLERRDHVDGVVVRVDDDDVAVLDQSDRASLDGFRHNVANQESVRATRETAVGEKSNVFSESAMAFSKAGLVMMSSGVRPDRSSVFMDSPMLSHSAPFSADTAGDEDDPGSDMPITSAAEAMVLAVYIPPQDPGPGHEFRTMSCLCSSLIDLLRYWPYDWNAETTSSVLGTPAQVPEPGKMVPPVPHTGGSHTDTVGNTNRVELHGFQAGLFHGLATPVVQVHQVDIARVSRPPHRPNTNLALGKVLVLESGSIQHGLRSTLRLGRGQNRGTRSINGVSTAATVKMCLCKSNPHLQSAVDPAFAQLLRDDPRNRHQLSTPTHVPLALSRERGIIDIVLQLFALSVVQVAPENNQRINCVQELNVSRGLGRVSDSDCVEKGRPILLCGQLGARVDPRCLELHNVQFLGLRIRLPQRENSVHCPFRVHKHVEKDHRLLHKLTILEQNPRVLRAQHLLGVHLGIEWNVQHSRELERDPVQQRIVLSFVVVSKHAIDFLFGDIVVTDPSSENFIPLSIE